MAERNPNSTTGNSEDFCESPPEDALQEPSPSSTISIVLAGKAAAGKTSLARNILGVKQEIVISAAPKTEECDTQKATKHGVILKVTDTVGLLGDQIERSKEIRNMSEHTNSKADILVYCIPATLSTVFKDGNPAIMKSLHRAYGPDIWKHCVVALTFSNVTLNTLKSTYKNDEEAISKYKHLLREYTTLFKKEVEKLNGGEVNAETIFGNQKLSDDHSTIVAIPVGWKIDDPVLPEFKITKKIKGWNDILIIEMARQSNNPEIKTSLLKYRFGPKIFDIIVAKIVAHPIIAGALGGAAGAATVGAGIGAGIGAVVGVVGGPVGLAAGVATGAAIGGAAGAVVGGAGGGGVGGIVNKKKLKKS